MLFVLRCVFEAPHINRPPVRRLTSLTTSPRGSPFRDFWDHTSIKQSDWSDSHFVITGAVTFDLRTELLRFFEKGDVRRFSFTPLASFPMCLESTNRVCFKDNYSVATCSLYLHRPRSALWLRSKPTIQYYKSKWSFKMFTSISNFHRLFLVMMQFQLFIHYLLWATAIWLLSYSEKYSIHFFRNTATTYYPN